MSPTYDYCVPVTVKGQAPGQSASVTLYVLAYAQPSDVAAAQAVQTQLAELCQLTAPNLLLDEFEVGQPMAVTVAPVTVASDPSPATEGVLAVDSTISHDPFAPEGTQPETAAVEGEEPQSGAQAAPEGAQEPSAPVVEQPAASETPAESEPQAEPAPEPEPEPAAAPETPAPTEEAPGGIPAA